MKSVLANKSLIITERKAAEALLSLVICFPMEKKKLYREMTELEARKRKVEVVLNQHRKLA